MRALAWKWVPVAVRAVLVGLLVLIAGTIPWSVLVSANLQHSPGFPWAVPVMAIYLWFLWRYLRGSGWPRHTSEIRRTRLRVSRPPGQSWRWSLLAGGSCFASLIAVLVIVERTFKVPQPELAELSRYSTLSIVALTLMAAVVAGLVEEAAFRGYMQVPLESRYGLWIAMMIVAIVFALAHLSHGISNALPLIPFYLVGSAVYSLLAYRTGSILPCVTLHISADVLLSAVAFTRATSASPVWFSCAAVVFAVLGVWSFYRLAQIARAINEISDRSVAATANNGIN